MKKIIFGLITSVFVFTGAIYAYASPTLVANSIDIKANNWYLLGTGSDAEEGDESLFTKAQYIYGYLPVLNRYILVKPNPNYIKELSALEDEYKQHGIDIESDEIADAILDSSRWYYFNKGSGYTLSVLNNNNSFELLPGWNFKYVAPWMVGDIKFKNLFGDCNVNKFYIYEPDKNEWINLMVNLDEDFEEEAIGFGFVINVNSSCTMKLNNLTPPVPTLPQ